MDNHHKKLGKLALDALDHDAAAKDLLNPTEERGEWSGNTFINHPTYNPETHVAVPREPTEAMIKAGYNGGVCYRDPESTYIDMLTAASQEEE